MKKLLLGFCFALVSCQGSDKPNIELIQDMMENPAIKPQEFDAGSPANSGMRVPPENTAPVGFKPYAYWTNLEEAQKELKNPLVGDMSEEVLFVGAKMYETHCTVCHGHKGEGGELAKSTVSSLMALKPPSLLSDKVRNMNDAHLYHIITAGQGVMGPYASHVPQNQRWQLVNYIRQLQQKGK